MFSGYTVRPDNKEAKLRSSKQETFFPSACKNISIVLVPYPTRKCASTAISGGVDTFEVPGYHLL